MAFEVALRFVAFFVGAFLHGVFVFGVLGRAPRRPSERVLRLFFTALFVWHAGSFLALALGGAAGEAASLLRRAFNACAFAGLALQPPLLIHAILAEGRERLALVRFRPREAWTIGALYLSVTPLPVPLWLLVRSPEQPPLEPLRLLVGPWTGWYALVLGAAAYLALRVGRETSPTDRRLETRLAASFLLTAGGLVYAYVLGGRFGPWGYTVETVVMASSILPTLVFTYYVYRYRVLGYFVRDGVVSLLASASFVAFYVFVVREVTRRLEIRTGIPALFLEAAVLMVLVLAFEPFGERLRGLARHYLAGGRERLRQQAAAGAQGLTWARSVEDVSRALRSALEGEGALGLARLLVTQDLPVASLEVGRLEERCPAIARELAGGRAWVRRGDPAAAEVLAELEVEAAHAALALTSKNRLRGALLLRAGGQRGLYPEDLEDLAQVGQAAALALEAVALAAEKSRAERKAAQAEKMASLGWLTASVAHEVKNPLGSIKAVAQVLQGEAGEVHPWREDLDLIVHEADRLDGSIRRLLASGAGSGERGTIDLRHALDRLGLALGGQARARGVSFAFELLSPEARVRATEEELWDILYNLAINALEAMPRGGVFRIEEREAGDPAWLVLEVSDDGPGIPAGAEDRVFEPFFSTKESGQGLGLAIVERRVRSLGGAIRIRRHARGSLFELELRR